MHRPKIAYFDDDVSNLKLYSNFLSNEFKLDLFHNPHSYKEAINGSYSAILIDVYMPGMDGLELYDKIKSHPEYNQCPVLFISSDVSDEIKCKTLASGGADFIQRLMKEEEMLLRLKNRVKSFQENQNIFNLGSVKLNLSELKVYLNSKCVDVTLIELKILKVLIKSYPALITREELCKEVWPDQFVQSSTLNTHLSNLRGKFKDWEFEMSSVKMKGIQIVEKTTV